MATLTIRDIDDSLKQSLRMRAAAHSRSMEEEVRQILRAALAEADAPVQDLGARIRSRFAGLGDVQLVIAPREPVREPPDVGSGQPSLRQAHARGTGVAHKRAA